jgi:hypothetical protein
VEPSPTITQTVLIAPIVSSTEELVK